MNAEGALRAYLRGLEGRFRRLRGSPLLVSPRDFALMMEWFERGVPLAVVTEAMDEAFARAPGGIGSLAYLRRPVSERFRAFREARLGAARGTAEDAALSIDEVRAFIERAHRRVRAAAGEGEAGADRFVCVARRLERLGRSLGHASPGLEAVERSLARIDRDLLQAAEARLGEEAVGRLGAEARGRLAPHRDLMSAGVFERSVRHHRDRLVREAAGVPELSLFQL